MPAVSSLLSPSVPGLLVGVMSCQAVIYNCLGLADSAAVTNWVSFGVTSCPSKQKKAFGALSPPFALT